jgi:hypothetical protein
MGIAQQPWTHHDPGLLGALGVEMQLERLGRAGGRSRCLQDYGRLFAFRLEDLPESEDETGEHRPRGGAAAPALESRRQRVRRGLGVGVRLRVGARLLVTARPRLGARLGAVRVVNHVPTVLA